MVVVTPPPAVVVVAPPELLELLELLLLLLLLPLVELAGVEFAWAAAFCCAAVTAMPTPRIPFIPAAA